MFQAAEGEGDEEEEKPEEEMTPEELEAKRAKEAEKARPKHLFIPEVVWDPKINFFDVPKLGSYLAVELKYQSCQFEDAFDKAYREHLSCKEKRLEQKVEREEFEKE